MLMGLIGLELAARWRANAHRPHVESAGSDHQNDRTKDWTSVAKRVSVLAGVAVVAVIVILLVIAYAMGWFGGIPAPPPAPPKV